MRKVTMYSYHDQLFHYAWLMNADTRLAYGKLCCHATWTDKSISHTHVGAWASVTCLACLAL